jgi:flavin-dependent thymidylate synthase
MTEEKSVQRYADAAMFRAEPLKASDGPKVFLLNATPDPLGAIAAAAKMYKGEVVRDQTRDITDEERRDYLAQMQRTKLKAPFEFVKMHFMVEGVTRSFTHQMVRQRTAVYAQESLRFAVKEDMSEGVAYPPSLHGVEDWDGSGLHPDEDQRMKMLWDQAVHYVGQTYNDLINMGMPAEDARGLLPHNITTRLNYATDLRALQDHAGNRLCTQAQFEWRLVWLRFIDAIAGYCSCTGKTKHGNLVGHDVNCDRWQFEAIAGMFRPVCYLTGKCEFKADFDRACRIRDRVEENHRIGRPSSEWHEDYVPAHAVTMGRPGTVPAIRPEEWMFDPTAARVRR